MRRLYLALPALLLGCMEQGFSKTDGSKDAYGPAIEVTPTFLDFGAFGSDDEMVVRTFTVQSVGGEDLHVEGITISSEDAGFTIVSEPLAFVLPPDESVDVDVAFSPAGAVPSANALVASDDPDNPEVPVELVAEFDSPLLEIDPDPLDFGTTYVGCVKDNTIDLNSVGTSTLTITDIAFEGDAFSLNTGYSLPIELEPGETLSLDFTFTPTGATTFGGALSVTSNEPMGVRVGTQSGTGRFGAEYTDEWVVPADPPTDIMFLVDQSCSMDDDTRSLAEEFETFMSTLSSLSTDWQIIVASNDDGCNQGGILTPDTSGYEDLFRDAVRECDSRHGCTYIVDQEALLIPAANGVDNTDSGECNAGFLREDALLHIIAVSDEPEQSDCDLWSCESDWENLLDEIVAKKGSESLTKVSAVAGPRGGCMSAGNSAEEGSGYLEIVAETGGVFLELCSDWGASAESLAEASVQLDTFELSHNAYEPSIVVLVNGVERTSGWSFDEGTNSVVFDTDAPDEGATVEISYGAPVDCD